MTGLFIKSYNIISIMKKTTSNIPLKKVEKLLSQQTKVILDAVDKKLTWQQKEINDNFAEFGNDMKEIKQSIRDLTVTLDNFLKRLTDFDDEFEIIKARVNKIEKILQAKLGVSVS